MTTYSETATDARRLDIVRESIASLVSSVEKYSGNTEVILQVVIDGAVPDAHMQILRDFNDHVQLIQKEQNGGIARAKNTCIRSLLEHNIDVGVLVDDDVWFGDGWLDAYLNMIGDLHLHHVVWSNDKHLFYQQPDERKKRNIYEFERDGYRLIRHIASAGIFLTFTPELIEKVGYFKVMPGKIGAEHIQFTRRVHQASMMNFPVDLADSHRFIRHLGYLNDEGPLTEGDLLSSVGEGTLSKEKINHGLTMKDIDQYFPCVE